MAQCAARISGEVDSCSMTVPVIDMQAQMLPRVPPGAAITTESMRY